MSSQHIGRSRRWQAAVLAFGVALAGLVATAAPAQATSTWSTYAGTGTGPIADGTMQCEPGEPTEVTFDVSGMPEGPLRGVRITDLMLTHTWVGDLTATLRAPDGSDVVLFSRTGDLAGGAGDSSDVSGPYTFSDAPTPNDWWAEAEAQLDAGTIPAGRYRATTPGGAEGGGVVQPITAAFAGVADPNGVWTLTFTDRCISSLGEEGTVDSADLQLQPSALGTGCAAYQDAVDAAAAVVGSAEATVASARTTLVRTAEAVGVAQSGTQLAASDATRAAAATAVATTALSVAKTRVTKAAKALKVAKRSHKKARIARAQTALKVAQAKQKVAQTVITVRQEASAAADAALAVATRAQTDRQAERDTAALGLATAQSALVDAAKAEAARKAELELCLDV